MPWHPNSGIDILTLPVSLSPLNGSDSCPSREYWSNLLKSVLEHKTFGQWPPTGHLLLSFVTAVSEWGEMRCSFRGLLHTHTHTHAVTEQFVREASKQWLCLGRHCIITQKPFVVSGFPQVTAIIKVFRAASLHWWLSTIWHFIIEYTFDKMRYWMDELIDRSIDFKYCMKYRFASKVCSSPQYKINKRHWLITDLHSVKHISNQNIYPDFILFHQLAFIYLWNGMGLVGWDWWHWWDGMGWTDRRMNGRIWVC